MDGADDRELELGEQERMHNAITEAAELRAGHVLTGWVVVYETVGADGSCSAGHLYGPESMTDWRALGLIEWASRYTIPGVELDDDEDGS